MGIISPRYKVAVVQAAPIWGDLEGTVDKTLTLIEQASQEGAKLVAFPETWLPGYPFHIWLGSPAWTMMRGYVQRYFENSLCYDSPQAQRIADAARAHDITVVLGLSEREGGSLYIAQWLIGADGITIAKRRKLRPTHAERTVFGEGDGSDLAVHDLADLGRVGALCCWEHLQPLTKYAMYAQNEQVHVAAWPAFSVYEPFAHALGWEACNAASKVYALEGSCFVLAPSLVVTQDLVDEFCDSPDKRNLIHAGGGHAVIYGPDGSPLAAKLAEDQEGFLFADLDLGLISLAKNAADPAGHYSRPDVTRLLFNNRKAQRVEYFSLPTDSLETSGESRLL